MSRRNAFAALAAGVIGIGVAATGATGYAKEQQESATNEAAILASAKITMAQAIAAAEQQAGGKAVGSGIEDQDGTVYFEVEVVKDNTRQKVLVDPQTGKVVKTVAADNEDNENGREGDKD